MKRKILVIELWGVGDLTFSTTLLRQAAGQGCEVHLLGKAHARLLLEPAFPEIRFFSFDAPWTRFRGKYRLWCWRWREIVSLISQLRRERYEVAVSVRNDPRDHLLMLLIGAAQRVGFATKGSRIFLTHAVTRTRGSDQHKVEDWRDLGMALGLEGMRVAEPELKGERYTALRVDALLDSVRKPIVCLHTGARIPVRRWPESHFEELIRRLRGEFDFQLVLVPDPDGYGSGLAPLADIVASDLTLSELVHLLARSDILLCNDSGPAHLAAACGRPVIALFGPTNPDWFRPWGAIQKVVIRDICPLRPCFDYCRFSEPFCLTRLLPEEIWPEVREHLLHLAALQVVPSSIVKPGFGDNPHQITHPAVHTALLNPAGSPITPFVVVVVATYQRAPELARLFASFQDVSVPLALVVVDNADDPETRAVVDSVQSGPFEVVRLVPETNLGCGGGLAFGERAALERYPGRLTHLWLLDDDTVLAPGALERLLPAMQSEKAALACPMVTNAEGYIDWFPGLLERPSFNAIRNKTVRTPAEYIARFGTKPVRFNWATGVSLLITREAIEKFGPHRDDFWIRGEDLEFSLRITAGMPGIFVPDAVVCHLPPPVSHSSETLAAEQKKEVAKIQNIAFISFHLPHGRRILSTLPGNYFRHLRKWGLKSLPEAIGAFWRGGVRARPAGVR